MEKYINIFLACAFFYILFAIPQFFIFNKMKRKNQENWMFLRDKYIENSTYSLLFLSAYLTYWLVETLQNPIKFPLTFGIIMAILSIQLSFAMYRIKQDSFIYPITEIVFVLIVVFVYIISTLGKINPVYLEKTKIVFAIIGALFIAVRGFETIEKKITPEMSNKKLVKIWMKLTSKEADRHFRTTDIIAILSVVIFFMLFIFYY